MENSKIFTVKKTQAGDDSGYSCTSTQSKYSLSQSASSGDGSLGKRRPSNTIDKSSTSGKKQDKTVSRDGSEAKITVDPGINSNCSNSEQMNLTISEPERENTTKDQSSVDVSELEEPTFSASKMEIDESNDLNDDVKEDHDPDNTAFLQLTSLCQSYRGFLNANKLTLSFTKELFDNTDTGLKIFNEDEIQLKDMIESDENTFGVVVSMINGSVVNTSDNIYQSMGYPKNMWQERSFIDFIHPEDRKSFTNYVTSVLTDPSTILRKNGTSTVTFLSAKNNDGFYCNMRRYNGLTSTGFSLNQKHNVYQVCKLTTTFKVSSQLTQSMSSSLARTNEIIQPQLLMIKAQLIYSAYTYPEEKTERPVTFITKHNALFKWCYVDNLIISHFGYLPQNIIGKSIFAYYNIDDLSTIKEIYENITTLRNVPYKGSPYRFKCQNGNFALIQTEWSNFVDPWSGRVEFVVGRHRVIQGPVNPDVTTQIDDLTSKKKSTEIITTENEAYEEIKKILNKNIDEDMDDSHQTTTNAPDSKAKEPLLSKKCTMDLELSVNNWDDPSINFSLQAKVIPEICGSFSNHESVTYGYISPYHSYENKSSSGTPPSYNQLNYNDNISRFFKSNLHTNSSDDELTQAEEKSPTFNTDIDKVQKDLTSSLAQSGTSNSSITVNDSPANCNLSLEENLSQSSIRLTQKMLLRHNKKMEDDLVNQHKNKTKKIKSNETQQQQLLEEFKDTSDINLGVKRNHSSQHENNKQCKIAKTKHLENSNLCANEVFTQIQQSYINVKADTSTAVVESTQVLTPYKLTKDAQTKVNLPCQVLCYNLPLTNNVMPAVKQRNEYENIFTLKDPSEPNPAECKPVQFQQNTSVPFCASVPVMNHITQNLQIVQPCNLLCHNQLLLQPFENNVKNENQLAQQTQNVDLIPAVSMPMPDLYQTTNVLEVNQEEIITSSDSECKREMRSFNSSNGWLYEHSSFYSSSLRDSSSDKEEVCCLSDFKNKPNFFYQFIKKSTIDAKYNTPEIIFRYQMEQRDVQEVLQKDRDALNALIQPALVNEQFEQLCSELDANGTSNTLYFEDGISSSDEDYHISIGANKKRKTEKSQRMAMMYEENAPLGHPE